MKRLRKTAGYDFSYENVNKILDAMQWKGDGNEVGNSVYFAGTIPVEKLKSQFGMTDEDINALPEKIQHGGVDFDSLIDDTFADYIDFPTDINTDDYELEDKEVNVKVLNGEFYIEGSATVKYQDQK